MVQGVGDACWYCGLNETLRRDGVTYPVSAHRFNPESTGSILGMMPDKDYDGHYYERGQ